jgi:hypothetical protein
VFPTEIASLPADIAPLLARYAPEKMNAGQHPNYPVFLQVFFDKKQFH